MIESDINDSEDNSNIENKYKKEKKKLSQSSINNNFAVCSNSNINFSADSNKSDEIDSDSNHDTSTDGEPYMKNVCFILLEN